MNHITYRFINASAAGDIGTVRLLLTNPEVDINALDGMALGHALRFGHTEIAELLKQHIHIATPVQCECGAVKAGIMQHSDWCAVLTATKEN